MASVRVLILTTFESDEHVFEGVGAGASGVMVRDSGPSHETALSRPEVTIIQLPIAKEHGMDTASHRTSPIEVFREWQSCLAAGDQAAAAKLVDVDGYTEICLGLTEWTTGYEEAAANFYRNMIAPWSDLSFTIEDLTESADGVTARSHVTATHAGEFLGIPPTGRHVEWDHVAIVKLKDGRVIGQWAQPDLWGIYTQLAP